MSENHQKASANPLHKAAAHFWVVVSMLTTLLPLLNKSISVLPLLPNQENLQITLATVFSLCALAVVYTSRHFLLKRSLLCSITLFLGSLLSVALYLYYYHRLNAFDPFLSTALVMLFTIAAVCLTAGFSLIAVREYLNVVNKRKE